MYTAVIVGVVSGFFFVEWVEPMKFPVGGPRVFEEYHTCEDGDG